MAPTDGPAPSTQMKRCIRYHVAASLDGYIAGPSGEYDWITPDPEVDFTALFARFDTFLIGRKTFETIPPGGLGMMADARVYVFSRTLRQEDHPEVVIVSERLEESLEEIRVQAGKDIWLFGGGGLFHSLLQLGEVDAVEVSVIPVLLGGGIPLLPPPAERVRLSLTGHTAYESGRVTLEYRVGQGPG